MNEEFEKFYSGHHGDRWPSLKKALLEEGQKTKLKNPFGGPEYELDPASVVAASQLVLQEDDRILDMCAAPGGKSLVLIYQIMGHGLFYLNDLSENRLQRLKRVIREYTSEEVQDSIKFAKSEGERWGMRRPGQFDCVLLDAPCSGEQHLMQTPKEYDSWSVKRARRLEKRQYGLLCSALLCARPGGQVVYSTCSVNPNENDGVIERLLDRKGEHVQVARMEAVGVEPTQYGYQIWPDKYPGQGPIYFSKLLKRG